MGGEDPHCGPDGHLLARTRYFPKHAREYIAIPELDTQEAKHDTNMTKTTEGLLSELNKTNEQNTTHEANIF